MFLGIDPGISGSIAVVFDGGQEYIKLNNTEQDIFDFLTEHKANFACIEKVASSPQMGVKSAFTFGKSFGFLIGILVASKIPFEFVSPQKWQKSMGCMSGGDKNITKSAAQRLFPNAKITHANADALLIAEYCRRYKKSFMHADRQKDAD